MLLALFLVFFICGKTIIADEKAGECPEIQAVPDFDMKKMLGTWYVIQKTDTPSMCVVYNISQTDNDGEYKIEEISEYYLWGWTPIKRASYSAVTLRTLDETNPGKMKIIFPFKVFGHATLTVFSTDYNTYAGIFTCYKGFSSHRQSSAILSRSRILKEEYVDELMEKLVDAHINPFDMSIVRQRNCTNEPSSASWGSFRAELIRKTGNTVTGGVEYVSGKSRAIYDTITGKLVQIREGMGHVGEAALHGVETTVEAARKTGEKLYGSVEETVRTTGVKARNVTRKVLGDAEETVRDLEDDTIKPLADTTKKQYDQAGHQLENAQENIRNTANTAYNNAKDGLDRGQDAIRNAGDNLVNTGKNYGNNLHDDAEERILNARRKVRPIYDDLRDRFEQERHLYSRLRDQERQWMP